MYIWKRFYTSGDKAVPPQDAAPEVQVRCAADTVASSGRAYLSAHAEMMNGGQRRRRKRMEKTCFIAIDLKSFYASVECVERGLSSTTNLVVVDKSRTVRPLRSPDRLRRRGQRDNTKA